MIMLAATLVLVLLAARFIRLETIIRMNARRSSVVLGTYYFGLILLLYLPIALLFLFSVNASASLSFPISQLTFDWYQQLFDADAVLRSARNSLVVALGSSLAATILGDDGFHPHVALQVSRTEHSGRAWLSCH